MPVTKVNIWLRLEFHLLCVTKTVCEFNTNPWQESIQWVGYCISYTMLSLKYCLKLWSIQNICEAFLTRSMVNLLIYVLQLKIQLSREGYWDPINQFNPVTFLSGPGFLMSYVINFLCSMIWGEMWSFVLLILVELKTITV